MEVPLGDQPIAVTEPENESIVVLTPAQQRFYASDDCATARQALQDLVDSPRYNTDSNYFSSSELGFVDRHLYHLSTHPQTNLPGYLSNLKLMTRSRV